MSPKQFLVVLFLLINFFHPFAQAEDYDVTVEDSYFTRDGIADIVKPYVSEKKFLRDRRRSGSDNPILIIVTEGPTWVNYGSRNYITNVLSNLRYRNFLDTYYTAFIGYVGDGAEIVLPPGVRKTISDEGFKTMNTYLNVAPLMFYVHPSKGRAYGLQRGTKGVEKDLAYLEFYAQYDLVKRFDYDFDKYYQYRQAHPEKTWEDIANEE